MEDMESLVNQKSVATQESLPTLASVSARKFYRIGTNRIVMDFSNTKHLSDEVFDPADDILDLGHKIQYESQLEIFYVVGKLLQSSVGCVPRIYDLDLDKQQLIVEDLGSDTLHSLILEGKRHGLINKCFEEAIIWLSRLHEFSFTDSLMTRRKLNIYTHMAEVKRFTDGVNSCLRDNGVNTTHYLEGFNRLVFEIMTAPMVITHRDFQTGNLMVIPFPDSASADSTNNTSSTSSTDNRKGVKDNDYLRVIDFQDMCLGPISYDIASLLYDCKVSLSNRDREYLIGMAWHLYVCSSDRGYPYSGLNSNLASTASQESHPLSKAQFERFVYLSAFHRLNKSLGWRIEAAVKAGAVQDKKDPSERQSIMRAIGSAKSLRTKLPDFTALIDQYISWLSEILRIVEDKSDTLSAIILAAGKGSRMKMDGPKPAATILGKSMVEYSVDAARLCTANPIIIVTGYKEEIIKGLLAKEEVLFVSQKEQLGTGHAVKQVFDNMGNLPNTLGRHTLILMGDMPTVNYTMLSSLIEEHERTNSSASILSTVTEDATGFSRIIREEKTGVFLGTIEDKDLNALKDKDPIDYSKLEPKLRLNEVSLGIYLFKTDELSRCLVSNQLMNDNAQKEYYLPDVIKIFQSEGKRITACCVKDTIHPHGANCPEELYEIEKQLGAYLSL